MNNITEIIGKRLLAYREQASLSREQLAEKAGIHPNYVGVLERGDSSATLETVGKVARALNLSFETLFANILAGKNESDGIMQEFHDLILPLPNEEKHIVYNLMKGTIEYKHK